MTTLFDEVFAAEDAAAAAHAAQERRARVRQAMLLYAVTDGTTHDDALVEQVRTALASGATCVQLREKHPDNAVALEEAFRLAELCRAAGVPFIVNDNVGIALACGADGIHVGQADLPCTRVRELAGAEAIIGVSAHTVAEALAAQEAGADYLGVGAMFPTATKADAEAVSADELRAICEAVSIPVVAIGGITRDTLPALAGAGIAGVACVSAIFAAPDIAGACKQLRSAAEEVVGAPDAPATPDAPAEADAADPFAAFPCRFTCAIFDFDGTLFDSIHVWKNAGPAFLATQGIDASPTLWERIRAQTLEQSAEVIQAEYHLALTVPEIMAGFNRAVEDAYNHTILPKPGAAEFVRSLRARGVRCVIATVTDCYLIEAALARCGMSDLFDDIFTCNALGTTKREPLIYRSAMEACGATRETSVVFEDAVHAAATAHADGFFVCGIASSDERQAALATVTDCILKHFTEPAAFWELAAGAEAASPSAAPSRTLR